MAALLNPCELEIDLFCRGVRIDPSCRLEEDARVFRRTRAGLGSGLELVLPGRLKDIWMNAPVEEDFAQASPYRLVKEGAGYHLLDERGPLRYPVRIPPEPAWYERRTARGTPMQDVGVLQGTYLGIYISNSCGYWWMRGEGKEALNCAFCTTGYNVGVNERVEKAVEDVVEVAAAAKAEGCTFTHFNTGFHGGRDLEMVAPYVAAVKERVGQLVGVQALPARPADYWKYDWLLDLGANHFSFCWEFHHPDWFARLCPGKRATLGQETFLRALEYCQRRMPKGACSGEIIAGVEPIEWTLRGIDAITDLGAFPTVCIFRPCIGSDMEHVLSPRSEDMVEVMRHMYEACRAKGIPIGAAPNIEVSLIVQPDDARYLAPRDVRFWAQEAKSWFVRRLAAPFFARELRPRAPKADPHHPPRPRPAVA
ncbi:MAG TPA: radical SAM protein [Planctomycetota bacterium]|nr:radical SAM protein [Planctomycetota bacterium]